MDRLYCLTMDDGSVSIMTIVTDTTPQAEIAKWPAEQQARVVSIEPVERADLPSDRAYRDAWRRDGRRVVVDATKRAAIDAARASRDAKT